MTADFGNIHITCHDWTIHIYIIPFFHWLQEGFLSLPCCWTSSLTRPPLMECLEEWDEWGVKMRGTDGRTRFNRKNTSQARIWRVTWMACETTAKSERSSLSSLFFFWVSRDSSSLLSLVFPERIKFPGSLSCNFQGENSSFFDQICHFLGCDSNCFRLEINCEWRRRHKRQTEVLLSLIKCFSLLTCIFQDYRYCFLVKGYRRKLFGWLPICPVSVLFLSPSVPALFL